MANEKRKLIKGEECIRQFLEKDENSSFYLGKKNCILTVKIKNMILKWIATWKISNGKS